MSKIVGLDYDGLIADSNASLSKAALEIYSTSIAPYHFHFQESEVLDALLHGNFEALKDEVYLSPEWIRMTSLMPGAKEGIAALLAANHKLLIITNRHPVVSQTIKQDLEIKLGFAPPPIKFLGRKVCKRQAAEEAELEVFVDDSLKKLLDLRGLPHMKHFICFTRRKVPEDIVAINSWSVLVDFINKEA